MTHRRFAAGLFIALLTAAVAGAFVLLPASADDPELARQGVLPMLAADGTTDSGSQLPPPDPSYCGTAFDETHPPEGSLFGRITIGGAPAPAGTVVQIAFNGKAGPAAFVEIDSSGAGYRIDYSTGASVCSNTEGSLITLLVNGQIVSTQLTAPSFKRFDITIP
ncbi:MAG: hypothetical protein ACM3S1_08930 [Hyphomicrobiales bacterium]